MTKETGRRAKRGFTLAELLIVVAIIAVLVAIAIPVLNSSLEKSREAADMANIRGAYAEVMVDAISDDVTTEITVALTQKADDWEPGSGCQATLAGLGSVVGTPKAGGTCVVSFDAENETAVFTFDGTGGSGSGGEAGSRVVFSEDINGFTNAYAALMAQYANAGNVMNDGNKSLNSKISDLTSDYDGHNVAVLYSKNGNIRVNNQMSADAYDADVINGLNNGLYWAFMEDLGNGQYKPLAYAYQINVHDSGTKYHNEVHFNDMSNGEIYKFNGNFNSNSVSEYVAQILDSVYG